MIMLSVTPEVALPFLGLIYVWEVSAKHLPHVLFLLIQMLVPVLKTDVIPRLNSV